MNVTGATQLFATFGNPNRGNPAPAAFNAAFETMEIDAVYVAIEANSARAIAEAVRGLNLRGGTITMPFKQDIIQYLDMVDDDALAIGAVNVIENRNGELIGHNSDHLGAVGALEECVNVAGARVAVLGAGGGARAIVYGLLKAQAEATVFNRTEAKAKALCEELGASFGGDLVNAGDTFDVLVNATSIGFNDPGADLPIDEHVFSNRPVVLDIITRPRRTAFLERATAAGCVTIDGTSMIAHLAVPTFGWLVGSAPPLDIFLEHFANNERSTLA